MPLPPFGRSHFRASATSCFSSPVSGSSSIRAWRSALFESALQGQGFGAAADLPAEAVYGEFVLFHRQIAASGPSGRLSPLKGIGSSDAKPKLCPTR